MTRPMSGQVVCISVAPNKEQTRRIRFDSLGNLNGLNTSDNTIVADSLPKNAVLQGTSIPRPAIAVDALSGDVYFGGGESDTSGILIRYHSQGTPGYSRALAGGKQKSTNAGDILIKGGAVRQIQAAPNYMTIVNY